MIWREGEKVGPYTILNQLGQGGMATVYRAYHPDLNRYVAIKVMHQTFLEDPTFLARFQREAQIVAGLEHPNIVPIYDYQQHAGLPYLVMKLIEGETLKGRIIKKALTLDQIIDVMMAVGSALSYAHQKGVLHRDVKPSNIVIANDNTPYVTDFGLARIAAAGESTISTDMVLGTPHYISPEQARGAKNLDGRADVYSLGVVLYELVVGRVPFTADTPYAIIHDHINTPLPAPSLVNPELPASLDAVLLKALAKDPQNRYSTADHLVKEFRDAITTNRLTVLNPERGTLAAASLVRLREELASDVVTPQHYSPPMQPPPNPSLSGVSSATYTPPQHPQAARRWVWGGLLTFLASCMLSAGVGLSAADTISQLTSLDAFGPPNDRPPFLAERDNIVYNVPSLSLDSAENRVSEQPGDAVGYLALARAAWNADENQKAEDAINMGLQVAEEQTRYLLTAAEIAEEEDEAQHAITYAVLAYNAAASDDELFLVREIAGEYLYQIVGDQRLDLQQIVEDAGELSGIPATGQASSVVLLLTARQHILNERLFLARQLLDRLEPTLGENPEFYLVQGEYYAASGNTAAARQAWEDIVSLPDETPLWIIQQTQDLLDTLEDEE